MHSKYIAAALANGWPMNSDCSEYRWWVVNQLKEWRVARCTPTEPMTRWDHKMFDRWLRLTTPVAA